MANGQVTTGLSGAYYALWASGDVYSNGAALARAVSVSLETETGDDNKFYADNKVAEVILGVTNSGTATITVDGLLDTARNAILGYTAPSGTDVWVGHNATAPYVGIGWVVRYISDGVTSYRAWVAAKCAVKDPGVAANTQEDAIEFQTEELEATLFADDAGELVYHSTSFATEAAAVAAIKTKFNIQ